MEQNGNIRSVSTKKLNALYFIQFCICLPLSIGELNCPFSIHAYPLHGAICKYALLSTGSIEILYCLIREDNLFSAIWVMLFDLVTRAHGIEMLTTHKTW